jgi:hypothetical protein
LTNATLGVHATPPLVTLAAPPPVLLLARFEHSTATGESVAVSLGRWMFKEPLLQPGAIAMWASLGGLISEWINSRKILEPINVVWADFVATTEDQSKQRIADFLKLRGYEVTTCSFANFFAYIDADPMIPSFAPGGKAWTDYPGAQNSGCDSLLVANNHGRVFPGRRVLSNRGNSVFITTGAFSRESELTHAFQGFNIARLNLQEASKLVHDDWEPVNGKSLGNEYHDDDYSTADHDGSAVVFAATTSKTIYEYTGNRFDRFSCGPLPGGGYQTCATPQPGLTSYSTNDFVSLRLTLHQRLPADTSRLPLCLVLAEPCKFDLVATDGRQVLTISDRRDLPISFSTDANGNIIAPWQVGINWGSAPAIASIIYRLGGEGPDIDWAWVRPDDFAQVLDRRGTWRTIGP